MTKILQVFGVRYIQALILVLMCCDIALSDGVVPSNQIQIINPRPELIGFSAFVDGSWKDFTIDPKSDVIMTTDEYVIKIYTRNTSSEVLNAKEDFDAYNIEDFKYTDSYFLRKLRSGQRWIICWSAIYNLWAIDIYGGTVCFQ